jgi:hypothetical protein
MEIKIVATTESPVTNHEPSTLAIDHESSFSIFFYWDTRFIFSGYVGVTDSNWSDRTEFIPLPDPSDAHIAVVVRHLDRVELAL